VRLLQASKIRALWSAIDAVSSPASSLAIAAGLVRTLGTKEYGVLIIALAVSNLSAALIPAISSATTKFVSAASGHRNANGAVSRILISSLLTVAAIDVSLLLATYFFRHALAGLVFGPAMAGGTPGIGAVMSLAVASICLQQLDGVFAATLKGLEFFGRQAMAEVLSRALLVTAALTTAWLTRDVKWVLTAYCAASAISGAGRALVVATLMGGRFPFSLPNRTDFSRLFHFGGWMWLNVLATIAYGTVDRIILGRERGTAAAAEFNIYLQFSQLIHFVPASLFAFSYPVFSRLGVDRMQNIAQVRHLYHRYFKAAVGIAVLLAVLIVTFRHPLFKLVGGREFPLHDGPLVSLVLGFLLLSMNVVPYCLCLGLGTSRSVSLITSISMLLSVIATVFLIPAFGMEGAAIARLVYGIGALTLLLHAHELLK